jgi:dihydroflavonol-4-reductase
MAENRVLVTGGSGFVAGHCIVQLLEKGYQVRTTVRSLAKEAAVREVLASAGIASDAPLSFVVADLTSDDGWNAAVEGCTYVLHVASPFPLDVPKHEDDLIIPARDGALRVLRASRDAGVDRVVMTSSFAAIGYGHGDADRVFTEEDWTNIEGPGIEPYVKSKTIAERAAWDFIAREGGTLQLAVINPVGIFGPVLGNDFASSVEIVRRIVDGAIPGYPKFSMQAVDVRDVAAIHLLAMLAPEASGQRFLATSEGILSMADMGALLRSKLGPAGKRIPKRNIPNFAVRLASIFDKPLRQVTPELGHQRIATSAKATSVLGWMPGTKEEAVLATAESLIARGLVKTTA